MCGGSAHLATRLTLMKSMVVKLTRYRRKNNIEPVEDVSLQDEFRVINDGKAFYFTIMKTLWPAINCLCNTIKFNASCENSFGNLWRDFFCCPKPYRQLYTFMCLIRGKTLPIVYALMESASKNSYTILFNALKPHFNVSTLNFMMKLEDAPIISRKDCCDNFTITGCYFHFCQCIWRYIQREGNQRMYKSNPKYQMHFKLVC